MEALAAQGKLKKNVFETGSITRSVRLFVDRRLFPDAVPFRSIWVAALFVRSGLRSRLETLRVVRGESRSTAGLSHESRSTHPEAPEGQVIVRKTSPCIHKKEGNSVSSGLS